MESHLKAADYTNYVYHAVIVQLTLMAIAEEVVRQLITEEEMAVLVAGSASDLAGMVAVTMRDLQSMKETEDD